MLNRAQAPQSHDIQGMTLVHPEHMVLDNGLPVYIFRSQDQPLVKAEFVFKNKFGAKSEDPLRNTALSALMKEGTSRMTCAQIAETVDYYGAFLMPEFSFDHTSYTLYTLNKYVPQIFPLVYDILVDAQLPDHELDNFKRTNRQSLQISLEKNDFVAKQLFYKTLFGRNRYGAVVTDEGLSALNRGELAELYTQQIQPENCTLFLSGNITADVIREVSDYCGSKWKNTTASKSVESEIHISSAYHTELQFQERADAVQSSIRIGRQSLRRTDADFPAIQFVNTLFGGYFGSRLMRNIREDKGYTYGIGSSAVTFEHTGMLVISTQVGTDVTTATLQEIQKEMNLLQTELVDAAEIKLVKNYMLGAMLGSLESIFSHADKFKAVHLSGLDLSYYAYYTKVLHDMDAEQVQTMAQKYLQYEDMVKVVVGKM
ncbi:M16 family metallopeptidase [Sphingobacterium chungjuense]|uniref:M16 family metallopeptidase n=1 Tax=Sphingobacterium chungjuense TaxID=2675553 RepID=UPI001408F8B1|nr:pitrilysin family protein [Sphingobacterium chungjuense]